MTIATTKIWLSVTHFETKCVVIWSPEMCFERNTQQTNEQKTLDLVLQSGKHSLHFLMQQQKEWTAKTSQQNDMTTRRICQGRNVC